MYDFRLAPQCVRRPKRPIALHLRLYQPAIDRETTTALARETYVRGVVLCATFHGAPKRRSGIRPMRSLLLSSMMLVATGLLHAQALPTPIPELTNVEEFSSRSGTLIQREFT